MDLQVYTSQEPAMPRRALIGSIFLLASACVLAATLTNRRTERLVDEPVKPPNWSISFQPPRLFRDMERGRTELGPTYVFSGKARNGSDALLFAYQITTRSLSDAGDICRSVVNASLWPEHLPQQRQPLDLTEEFLGDHGALQISDPPRGIIVRAAFLANDDAYALALQVQPGMLDSWAINLFDKVCDSVQRISD